MRRKIFFIFLLISYLVRDTSCQNLFVDPGFEEPIPIPNSLHDCQVYNGERFDKTTNVWRRSNDGSPEIMISRVSDCYNHMDKAFFSSQCVGLFLGYNNIKNGTKGKEPIETTLSQSLEKGKNYSLSFDILINKNATNSHPGFSVYNIKHVNIILKDSKNSVTDTLLLTVSDDANLQWSKCSLIFEANESYDVVQFDYISKYFYARDQSCLIYAYLDNFNLVQTTQKATVFKNELRNNEAELNSIKLTYYFDSDNSQLSESEHQKMLSDLGKLTLQDMIEVTAHGFTDDSHTSNYNATLSKKRAKNVLESIRKYFSNNSIKYIATGEGIDKSMNKKLARRVDVLISYKEFDVAPWYQTSNNPQRAINYSFLHNTGIAQKMSNVQNSLQIISGQSLKFDKRPFDSDKMILAKAKNAKILIINESHTSPSHRAYIANLLPRLQPLGYNKLAIEALLTDNDEHSLTIKDPVFLRYLLEAKRLGFDLSSYDNKTKEEPDWDKEIKKMEGIEYKEGFQNMAKDMNIRDYNQFLNLKNDIDNLRDGEKIIIHVGHGHGEQFQKGDWKPLGAYLAEKYSEELVLSIDQVTLNNCIYRDSNYYYNQYKPKKSIICSTNGKPYVREEFNPISMSYMAMVDLQILHSDDNLDMNSDTSIIHVSHGQLETANYPLAIMIYQSSDDPKTDIAYSAIEVKHAEDWKPSIVPNDFKYKILIKDANNQVILYDTDSK